ncbi:CFC_HP_G0055930.mRNA.1.CDS.1 [Saccharomyces cerevisiae]|nr:YGL231C-like protein [Saccharomyces cerevisiae FostersB]CAI4935362.1 CFC_HP_G0053500.mRNA.1.CDS.1 [Saccharomyces cerevisiae]CAI4938711.1 CFC_HP_G0055930.mRNA.1.CDS.1 [Saccharomyces cerevisiae]CAI4989055.1 ATV_HP_G0131150.mRNA.1.CDS.1 [Saccharomyces cerevisiae]CAI5183554.1 ATV_HP_G0066310.mRNA.1.CDS.1 [Saccharomyces cerevisiae]
MSEQEPYEWAKHLLNTKYIEKYNIQNSNTLPSPPGFEGNSSKGNVTRKQQDATSQTTSLAQKNQITVLQVQKAWQIALQPAKSIPMNIFMSYMSGTSLQIIPIMTALMLLSGPIKAIFSTRSAFKPVLGNKATQSQVQTAMFMYIVFQGVLMYIGYRKLNSMGLIPNAKGDWLPWERIAHYNNGLQWFSD